MEIKEVATIEEAKYCNHLLTELIKSESKTDSNINPNFIVENWFEERYLKKDNALFVAVLDQKIVGYCYIRITTLDGTLNFSREALLDGLFVLEEYRNKKIGTKLVKSAKEWAIKNDVKYLNLSVLENNKSALALYAKEGFLPYEKKLRVKLEEKR